MFKLGDLVIVIKPPGDRPAWLGLRGEIIDSGTWWKVNLGAGYFDDRHEALLSGSEMKLISPLELLALEAE